MSDVLDSHDNRTITLTDDLDAAQEPNNASDSEATGTATLTITFNPETGEASYSSALSAMGQCEDDLQTPIPDVVSAIHLHNTPAAVNGPVVQDTLTDASAEMDGAVPSGITGLDVIDNTVEVDILSSIENVFGSNDSNVLPGSGGAKALDGRTVMISSTVVRVTTFLPSAQTSAPASSRASRWGLISLNSATSARMQLCRKTARMHSLPSRTMHRWSGTSAFCYKISSFLMALSATTSRGFPTISTIQRRKRLICTASSAICPTGTTAIWGKGLHLSGDQRQRITLARALYGDPFILMLDEPNSDLDGQGRQAMRAAIKDTSARGAVIFVMTHKPCTLEVFNKVLTMWTMTLVTILTQQRAQAAAPPHSLFNKEKHNEHYTHAKSTDRRYAGCPIQPL